jgi:pectinesterase
MTDCNLFEAKDTAAVWHDGSKSQDQKFVLRNCKIDGVEGFNLARHHHDGQFYFLDCTFAKTMIDKPPFRVIYPLNGQAPTDDDRKRNADLDETNIWGERSYYVNCHHDGGDYQWHKDNLQSAPGAPKADQITPAWTFGGTWDPENSSGPVIRGAKMGQGEMEITFGESVTVKGKPRLVLVAGKTYADYASGSGSETLKFKMPMGILAEPKSIDLNGGSIIASVASATIREANLNLPVDLK